MMSQYKLPQQFPLFTILALAGCFTACIVGLWHFKIEPIYSFVDPLYSFLAQKGAELIGGFNIGGIVTYVQDSFNKNPIGFLATVGSLVTAAVTVIGKIRADNMKRAVEESATKQISDIDNKLRINIADLEAKTQENINLKTQLEKLSSVDTTGILTAKDTQISNLQSQLNLMNDLLNQKNEELLSGIKIIEKVVVK